MGKLTPMGTTGNRSSDDESRGEHDGTSVEEVAARATAQWGNELAAGVAVAGRQLETWFKHTGWSQGQASRVLNSYLARIGIGRKVSAPTFSRMRRDPEHVMHFSLAVVMTMAHVYGHTLTDLAKRIDAAVEREHRGTGRQALAQAEARAAEEAEVADMIHHLTDAQLHDAKTYFGSLARENQQYRADLFEQEGTALNADVPGLEVEAAARTAQRELDEWAQRQRARPTRQANHTS